MLVVVAVLGDQRRFRDGSLVDDEPVEGIAGPALRERAERDLGKGQVADLEAEVSAEDVEHLLDRIGEPPNLEEVLQLDERHRRDQDLARR